MSKMYVRIDTDGNAWNGTAKYKKVTMPKEVKNAMENLQGLAINEVIKAHGGDVLATRRPDLIDKKCIIK